MLTRGRTLRLALVLLSMCIGLWMSGEPTIWRASTPKAGFSLALSSGDLRAAHSASVEPGSWNGPLTEGGRDGLDGTTEGEAVTDTATVRPYSGGAGGGPSLGSWRATRWPASELSNVWAIDGCESQHGTHPRTYDLNAENGGRMQINKATWERFFLDNYGWPWEQVVLDDATNFEAAYIIWEQAGRSWLPWACGSW